ncbi:hypothetical protein DUI87_05226 [Hirundo rustica rustica]|uniref:Uncharacterized protein n=1 Tax=Hirundo rustica rustica TaxID=333673 RepID=A0A3M0KWM1_HIRRU|nr:hypothetical protein DUI87_05226 [Hirundo rustica rustica]
MAWLRLLNPITTFCRDISEEKTHPAAEASPSNTNALGMLTWNRHWTELENKVEISWRAFKCLPKTPISGRKILVFFARCFPKTLISGPGDRFAVFTSCLVPRAPRAEQSRIRAFFSWMKIFNEVLLAAIALRERQNLKNPLDFSPFLLDLLSG